MKELRFTIPVTSPAPIVVALTPMVRVFAAEPSHMSRLPFVVDGFSLCKRIMPFTAKSLLAVTPPSPLTVKLLILPEKMEAGRVIAVVLVKARVAEAFPASIVPLIRLGELPAMVKVFAARPSVPVDKFNSPFTVMFWLPKVTPPAQLRVRLLMEGVEINTSFGMVMPPEPPNVSDDAGSTAINPEVLLMVPFIPRVISPTFRVPLVSVRILFA
jgi:hypothetical protein